MSQYLFRKTNFLESFGTNPIVFIIVFILALHLALVKSQSLQILSELDTSIASVGDQVVWNVHLDNIDKNLSLEFPKLEIKNDSISLISQSNILDNNLIIGQSGS